MPLPIALVSPSPLVRAGLRAGLMEQGGFDPRLDCASFAQARDAAFGEAEVAIVDGIEGVPMHAGDGPALVLLLPADADASEWLRAGIGTLPSDAPIAMIAAAAIAAAAGLVAGLPAAITRAMRPTGATRAPSSHSSYESNALEPITPREHEVLAQMAFGLANREIADALGMSAHTAKFHVAQIIAKLDASSRTHAVAKALRAGLVVA